MKKTLTTILVLVLGLFLITPAHADIVTLAQNQSSYGVGGEFTATMVLPSNIGNYSPLTSTSGSFETFCIQTTVNFYPNQPYNYTIANTDSQGNSLALGTAYLYYQFALGTLDGYDYQNIDNRLADAGLLQQAIWYLQGGQTEGGVTPTVANNPYYAQALNLFGEDATSANNQYSVQVLQLTDGNGTPAQNQLILTEQSVNTLAVVPEPSTMIAGVLLLLPLGVASIRAVSKKKLA